MKAATLELETAMVGLGAEMSPASRRQTALLASELIAQVAGRDLDHSDAAVEVTLRFRPNRVRLETCGPAMPSATRRFEPDAANGLAEWGRFVLDRLSDRWGIDDKDHSVLWAEIQLPAAQVNGG
jgi:hypothetical protein